MATIEHGLRQRQIQEKKSGINKKFAALALTGAVALGGIGIFAASQQGENTKPEPTPIIGGIGNPNETNKPNQTPEVSPSESENNPENSMEGFAVNTWIDMLSSNQTSEENEKYLSLNVNNKEEWQAFLGGVDNASAPTDPLSVSFQGGFISPSSTKDGMFSGHKMSGQVEFDNISLAIDEQELTAADKSKGYSFKGLVEISYAERYSNYFYEPANLNDLGSKEAVLDWIHQPGEENQNFINWVDGSVKFPIIFVNGEWKTDLEKLRQEASGFPRDSYNGFLIPFKSYYSTGCGEQQASCKIIYNDLPY